MASASNPSPSLKTGRRRAGAVVVRVEKGERQYLLIGPVSGKPEWLLPKGHIDAGETAEAAALREVAEEAGVRVALVQQLLETKLELKHESAQVTWFLAMRLADTPAQETRASCWLPYQQARESLTFEDARQALTAAEQIARDIPFPPAPADEYETQTLHKQLEFLNARLHETSDTANQFLTRFMFGGMVAVLALLNLDLVLLKEKPNLTSVSASVAFGVAVVLALLLSYFYFRAVAIRYTEHRQSHRKLKYKYELTLHALLSGGRAAAYARRLEVQIAKSPEGSERPFPEHYVFSSIGDYLLDHHQRRYAELSHGHRGYVQIAMLLVGLTLVVRLAGLFFR